MPKSFGRVITKWRLRRRIATELPTDFAPHVYLEIHKDLREAGVDPVLHYIAYGKKEMRRYRHYEKGAEVEGADVPLDFDPWVYLKMNPDVDQAGLDPFEHYRSQGRNEGRAYLSAIYSTPHKLSSPCLSSVGLPSEFDPFLYLQANPDVAAAGLDPTTHFIEAGQYENRRLRLPFRPLPANFDPDDFIDTKPSRLLGGVEPLADGSFPWPLATFHYNACDHDKLFRNRAIISHLYLKGYGLEIDALNAPLPIRADAKVRHLTSIVEEKIVASAPHLRGLVMVKPASLVENFKLAEIETGSQDFLILNNALPFYQDPIAVLRDISRVVRPGGCLYISVPDQRFGADFRRKVTPLKHFWEDFENGPEASRSLHYLEFTELVIGAGNQTHSMANRLNHESFPIHFHCWTHHSFIRFIMDVLHKIELSFEMELCARNEVETIGILRRS
jgi:SAM-dependent methyltransferase